MPLPHTSYHDKSMLKAYSCAIFVTFSAALGFLCAFLWRDIILALLKKYQWYDEEKICKSTTSLCWLVFITVIITLFSAFLVVFTVKYDKYLNG